MTKLNYSEAQIRDEALKLLRGSVDGKPAWTDGCMMEIGTDNPFTRLKSILWSGKKPDFQSVADGIKGRKETPVISEKPISPRDYPLPHSRLLVELKAEKAWEAIDQKYYNFFKSRYPNCQFRIAPEDYRPISVYENSTLVGIVMPFHLLKEWRLE